MSEIFAMPILLEAPAFAVGVAMNGAGIGALLLLTVWLLRRGSERLLYGILLGGIVVLLSVPALVGVGLQLPPALVWPPTPEEVLKVPAERLPELLARSGGENAVNVGAIHEATPWGQILGLAMLGLWMLGIAMGVVRLLSALWQHSRAIIGQPWRAAYWTDALQAQFARHLGLAKFPAVYRSPVAPMPMVVGTWRPVIVVPEQAPASWGQPQWEAILLHEAAHIARRDPWAVLAQRLAVVLFWWCPFVHGISRRLSALRENICDDYALAGTCDPIAYAEILIESAERLLSLKSVPVRLALLDSAQRGLEVRVTRLLAKEKRPMTKLSILGKLLGAGVLGAACLVTTAATALSQPQPEKKVQIKVIVDGKEIDLSDPKLWEHIQAAQKKAEADRSGVQFRYVAVDLPRRGDQMQTAQKKADPPVSGVHHGYVTDADSAIRATIVGKVVDKNADDGTAGMTDLTKLITVVVDPGHWYYVQQQTDQLVKWAEAIKPGSGAAIRDALQGTAKKDGPDKKGVVKSLAFTPDGKQIAASSSDGVVRIWDSTTGKPVPAHVEFTDGKKIIILSIDGDKVIQLQKSDVKKYLEGGVLSISPSLPAAGVKMELKPSVPSTTHVHVVGVLAKDPESKDTKKATEQPRLNLNVVQSKTSDTKPVAPNPSADLDALRRQIERLSAELKALERRMEIRR